MTAIAKVPFKDVTREGIEGIRAVFADGIRQTSELIELAARDAGEDVVDLFHPSERALEIDWERDSYATERHRARVRHDVFWGTLSIGAMVLAACFSSFFFMRAQPAPGIISESLFISVALVLGLVLFGPLFYSGLTTYVAERRLGYTKGFIDRCVQRRANVAVGTSAKAVYFCLPKDDQYGVLLATRIPLDEIQTCSFHEHEGTEIATLYTKSGKSFPIAMPNGNGITGAASLAAHIRKLASI